jgi:hypothetical protein
MPIKGNQIYMESGFPIVSEIRNENNSRLVGDFPWVIEERRGKTYNVNMTAS